MTLPRRSLLVAPLALAAVPAHAQGAPKQPIKTQAGHLPSPPPPGPFAEQLLAAWNDNRTLNWTGGDVTLTAPIVLQATGSRDGFGLLGNGARIVCNFNNANAYAITLEIPPGAVNAAVRNFQIRDLNFRRGSPFKGGLEMRCLTNKSWIYSYHVSDLSCEHHSDYGFRLTGSVFEGVHSRLKTGGGVGGCWIERADFNGNGDFGLPSRLEFLNPNFRDGSGHGFVTTNRVPGWDPWDIRIIGGYIVSMGGRAVVAPSGILLIDGLGFEHMNGGTMIQLGFRGGILRNILAMNSSRPNSTPTTGMGFVFHCSGLSGVLVVEDVQVHNYPPGSGLKLGRVDGGGIVYASRVDPADIERSGSVVFR